MNENLFLGDSGYPNLPDVSKLKLRIAELEAQLAGAQKDQARYQWLKNNNGFNFNNEFDIGKFQISQKKHRGEAWYLYLEELDKAIDAAIQEKRV
jgi:hypothetical protein